MNVPLSRPSISQTEIDCLVEVFQSGWLAHGPYNQKFEEAFSQYIDAAHAISMNSCTSALEVALEASQIRGEVIVPSFTWVATANAVINTGGTPIFCEVDYATRNMQAAAIAALITPRTEAVIVVHYGGQICAMDDIVELCQKHNLLLIEDSAETLGSTWCGRQAGSFGLGCFSFFPTKNITTAEGGMLTCRDDKLARQVRALIAHGLDSTTHDREKETKPWWRAAQRSGHNFRMPNPLAALGLGQLNRLEEMNAKRRELAKRYDQALASLVNIPALCPGATHVYQMYTITVEAKRRDQVVHHLRAQNIGASVHFDPPVHMQPFYLSRGCKRGQLPLTEKLASEIITLPLYPDMTFEQQDYVIKHLVENKGA